MLDGRATLGQIGEKEALRHLKKRGLSIIESNFRCRIGELDIIARDGSCLVFVEVRSKTGSFFGTARESIDPVKRRKIRRLAEYYLLVNKLTHMQVRFDVVAVTLDTDRRVSCLDHIVNAF